MSSTHKYYSLLLSAMFSMALGISSVGSAQVNQLDGTLLNPFSDPVPLVAVSLLDPGNGNSIIDSGGTDSQGNFSLFVSPPVTSATYTLRVDDGAFTEDLSVNIDDLLAVDGIQSETFNLTMFPPSAPSGRVLEVNVFQAIQGTSSPNTSSPISSAFVFADTASGSSLGSGFTNANGLAYIQLSNSTDDTVLLVVDAFSTTIFETVTVTPGTSNVSVNIVVPVVDAQITVNLQDANGSPFSFNTGQVNSFFPDANCTSSAFDPSDPTTSSAFYYSELSSGATSATVQVPAGTYFCSVWAGPDLAFDTKEVMVSSNGSASTTVTQIDASQTVTVDFVDSSTGDLITATEFDVILFTDPLSVNLGSPSIFFSADDTTTDGSVDLDLVPNQVYFGIADALDTSTGIVSPISFYATVLSTTTSLEIEVDVVDASLQICLNDSNGNPISEGIGYAFSPDGFTDTDSGPVPTPTPASEGIVLFDDTFGFYSEGDLSSGCTTLKVPSGVELLVSANPTSGGELLITNSLPELQSVTLNAGESRTVTFQLFEPNFSLTVSPTAGSSAALVPLDNSSVTAYCSVERVDGVAAFSSTTSSSGVVVGLNVKDKKLAKKKQASFAGICAIFDERNVTNGTGTQYFSDPFIFTPDPNTDSASLALNFSSGKSFYQKKRLSVDSSKQVILPIPIGTLTIPQGAISSQNGVYTLSYNSPRTLPRVKGAKFLDSLNITPEQNLNAISKVDKKFKICFDYTDNDLEGGDLSSLKIAHINPV
ncbi:MAG: hypothetical protein KDD70_14545, partial [Bdellovibrionales bacterium]|nr:hypothetical protein [Bdellovibrionales bacterium]